jgi:hypothetical protein
MRRGRREFRAEPRAGRHDDLRALTRIEIETKARDVPSAVAYSRRVSKAALCYR